MSMRTVVIGVTAFAVLSTCGAAFGKKKKEPDAEALPRKYDVCMTMENALSEHPDDSGAGSPEYEHYLREYRYSVNVCNIDARFYEAISDGSVLKDDALRDLRKSVDLTRLRGMQVKLAHACAGIYGSTIDKKVADLSVRETEAVRECREFDIYPPTK